MDDLRKLQSIIGEELGKIREKKDKTLNDRYRYEQLQKRLKEVYDVTVMLSELKNGGKLDV